MGDKNCGGARGRIRRWLWCRQWVAVAFVGASAVVLRISLLPLIPVRAPEVQDEFSHLLAGDTFASGRLANPAHPMWVHFETCHVNHQPTYMSMYPPAQGGALAVGQLLGHPWIGVLLSVAAMCASICWMLQGWLPAGWAIVGGLLAALRFGAMGPWINSYSGGAVAAAGGALVLGAMTRLSSQVRLRHWLLMAAGIVILANSRPYEGIVLSVATMLVMLPWFAREIRSARVVVLLRSGVLVLFVLCVAGAWMAYYNWRLTGDLLQLPQQLNRETYAEAQYFLWQHPRSGLSYRHAIMEEFYHGWEMAVFSRSKTLSGWLRNTFENVTTFYVFYFGPAIGVVLLYGRQLIKDTEIRRLLVIYVLFSGGLALNIWFQPHYAAPITAVVFAIMVRSLQHFDARLKGLQSSRLGGKALVIIVALAFAVVPEWAYSRGYLEPGGRDRADILEQLRTRSGRHLVVVRYAGNHNPLRDWVYNEADIDGAKVVWAREMGMPQDLELLRYFRDRHFWLVQPDVRPVTLSPYISEVNYVGLPHADAGDVSGEREKDK